MTRTFWFCILTPVSGFCMSFTRASICKTEPKTLAHPSCSKSQARPLSALRREQEMRKGMQGAYHQELVTRVDPERSQHNQVRHGAHKHKLPNWVRELGEVCSNLEILHKLRGKGETREARILLDRK